MKRTRILAATLAVLVANAVWAQSADSTVGNSPPELLKSMVQVLNSRSEEQIRNFIRKWNLPNVPIEQRVNRWMDLSSQGGPFKFVSDPKVEKSEVVAMVVDRNGMRLAFRLHFQTSPSLLIVGLQIAPAFTVEGPSNEFGDWSSLKGLASSIAKKAKSPGMGIAVIRNGVLQVGVDGVRTTQGKDPIQQDDTWSIGSIGKPICSTVIGRLIDQHKLAWDETLKTALPGVPMDKGYERVTIEEIMHHRGGIPEDLGFRRPEVMRIVGSVKTPSAIRDRYIRDILSRKPIAKPNERFVYSNAGYALLSNIAERVGGRSYESLVKDLIFKPLGLKHSFTGGDVLPLGRPSGYVEGPLGLEAANMSGPMESMFAGAGGGLYMSVSDLAKFGATHLNGLRGIDGILKSSTIKRLHIGFAEQPGMGRLYACGWGIETLKGLETFHGHNGSNGTMRAQLAIFPRANLVVVGIVNRGGESEPAPGLEAVMAIARRYASVH